MGVSEVAVLTRPGKVERFDRLVTTHEPFAKRDEACVAVAVEALGEVPARLEVRLVPDIPHLQGRMPGVAFDDRAHERLRRVTRFLVVEAKPRPPTARRVHRGG